MSHKRMRRVVLMSRIKYKNEYCYTYIHIHICIRTCNTSSSQYKKKHHPGANPCYFLNVSKLSNPCQVPNLPFKKIHPAGTHSIPLYGRLVSLHTCLSWCILQTPLEIYLPTSLYSADSYSFHTSLCQCILETRATSHIAIPQHWGPIYTFLSGTLALSWSASLRIVGRYGRSKTPLLVLIVPVPEFHCWCSTHRGGGSTLEVALTTTTGTRVIWSRLT